MTDWHAGAAPDVATLSADDRATLAARWRAAGERAHRLVGRYSQLSLQLMALAAGPDLLFATHQAAIDVVRHSRLCFALASAYAGRDIEPTPLAPPNAELVAPLPATALALGMLHDGCYGAALSARRATAALEVARDTAVIAALRVIAEDETRHAALAWDVVALCLRSAGDELVSALHKACTELPVEEVEHVVPSPALQAHGVLGSDGRDALARTLKDAIAARVAALR